jgi:hypothetical protein
MVSDKKVMWHELIEFRYAFLAIPWFLVGDFNETLYMHDKAMVI